MKTRGHFVEVLKTNAGQNAEDFNMIQNPHLNKLLRKDVIQY